jgi:hypothetical protein
MTMILTSQQLYELHNPNYAASRLLTVPLSDDGWNRIDEISQDMPKLTLAEIIEKALVIAWHADNKEFA